MAFSAITMLCDHYLSLASKLFTPPGVYRLNQQDFFRWWEEVQNHSVGSATLSPKALGENCPMPHGDFLAIVAIPWLAVASVQSLPLSAHCLLLCISL